MDGMTIGLSIATYAEDMLIALSDRLIVFEESVVNVKY